MPHNTLRLQGGTIVNETPVLNSVGIASSNRIRFKYDPQGLTLVEKIGGWAKFFASTITAGVVRALWGWQDTNSNQWIGFAADSSTASELGAIQCTVNGSSGLTSATGSVQNITPVVRSSSMNILAVATAGSNQFTIQDFNLDVDLPPRVSTVFITNPISVGGVILQGQQSINQGVGGTSYVISAVDILGNPLNAIYTTHININISGITFTAGTPNTLTISWAPPTYTFPVGENVNVDMGANTATGSYIVLSNTTLSVTVATTLSSYTFSGSGTISNQGVVAVLNTTASSPIITVTLPDHGLLPGDDYTILNPTLVGGVTLQGVYTVISVPNTYTLTFNSLTVPSATSQQYQGALTVSGGSLVGSSVTLDTATVALFNMLTRPGPSILVVGVNPANWNGAFGPSAIGTSPVSITYTDASATGSYVSGGSYSFVGGLNVYIYNITNAASIGTTPYPATFWTLDSWGNDLIACSGHSNVVTYPNGFAIPYQPIFYWDPTQAFLYAQAIANAPTASNGAFVAMPQRQIVAWGSTFTGVIDPLLVRWSDVNNFNTWVAQVTNQAGSFRLASGAAIIGGRQTPQQGLLWTDIEVWSMTYINQPLVYGFNKIGQGCGLIGRYAHGILNGIVYWMGKTQFFMLSGDGVVAIPCPIWDVAFQDLDLVNVAKITCATNAMFQEIAWYFPVKSGTGENSNYVKLNVSGMIAGQPPLWDFGTLDRSAWIDVSVLQQPIGFSPANKLIYQHEISPDADGAAMGETFTTGWFSIAEGDQMPFVDQVWPDFYWGYFAQAQSANINITISGTDYPGTSAQTVGPYTVTQSTPWISPRMRHRLMSYTVAGTGTGTWWRTGGIRYRFQADGKF